MHVQVAADVTFEDEAWQRAVLCRLDFLDPGAQLRGDEGQVEPIVQIVFRRAAYDAIVPIGEARILVSESALVGAGAQGEDVRGSTGLPHERGGRLVGRGHMYRGSA